MYKGKWLDWTENGESRLIKGGSLIQPCALGTCMCSGDPKAYELEDTREMADGQVEYEITNTLVTKSEKYLSPERLAGYYKLARGDRKVGLLLYERNTELSEALYGVIQGLEVTLRNAMHNIIAVSTGQPDWYDTIGLNESEIDAIYDAKKKIEERAEPITPGRVVAELNFGFWVRLTGWPYEKTLWVPYLHKVFPIKLKRTAIHDRLLDLKSLRNRIAHHQRIVGGKRDLVRDYDNLLETISWLDHDMAEWVKATNCFHQRANKKLRKPTPHKPPTLAAAAEIPKT